MEEKEYNGIIETENFTDDDFDNFLDYLEDLEDLDDDYNDDFEENDDDDDSNETEIYDIVPTRKNKRNNLTNVAQQAMRGVNIGMNDNNGSSININSNGISFNISLDSIVSGINSLSNAAKDANYKRMKRQLAKEKAKNRNRKK